jgi:hypothetical protein
MNWTLPGLLYAQVSLIYSKAGAFRLSPMQTFFGNESVP